MKFSWDFREIEKFVNETLDASKLEEQIKSATVLIAEALEKVLRTNTPVVTGELRKGWNGNGQYRVSKARDGYMVEIINTTPYASSVNDGHYSHNQYGGPYEVDPKKRTVPYNGQFGGDYPSDSTYVFGRFFVEKSIVQFSAGTELERIIYKELEKWFEGK